MSEHTGVCPEGVLVELAFHSPKDALLFAMEAQVRQQPYNYVDLHGVRGGLWDAHEGTFV